MKNGVYLLLGSNLGDREGNLFTALQSLQSIGSIVTVSSIYETKAWGNIQQPDFLNQVIQITFKNPPELLLREILTIENNMGRVRSEKWGSRIIDIDILFVNQAIVSEPDLIIPHPQLHLRKFTLQPLTEIAPEFVHPVFKKNCHQLLEECSDHSVVELYKARNAS